MIFRSFHEPLPLGSGFSCVVVEEENEHWTKSAIDGLVGQRPRVTTPSGSEGVYQIEWARRREDGLIEITAVPVAALKEQA